jgi:hypothetical protein
MSSVEETAAPRKRGRPKINFKRPPGRPTSYTEEKSAQICRRITEGETLRSVCRDTKMPDVHTVLKWLNKFPDFLQRYSLARDAQADSFADTLVDIAWDDKEADARSRLKIDTLKWLMARMAPRKYGDKTMGELAITVTLADLVNQSYEPKLVEGKVIENDEGK